MAPIREPDTKETVMQHLFADSFAQHRQADLLRDAELARLADLATGAAGRPSLVSKAIAAAGRLLIGETGVATRHAVAGPIQPTRASGAIGRRSPAVATTTSAPSGRRAATAAAQGITRPSPSL